jgi:hypothetical protein
VKIVSFTNELHLARNHPEDDTQKKSREMCFPKRSNNINNQEYSKTKQTIPLNNSFSSIKVLKSNYSRDISFDFQSTIPLKKFNHTFPKNPQIAVASSTD